MINRLIKAEQRLLPRGGGTIPYFEFFGQSNIRISGSPQKSNFGESVEKLELGLNSRYSLPNNKNNSNRI